MKISGIEIYLPVLDDGETPEENEAFARAHLINHGKTSPHPKYTPRQIFKAWLAIVVIMIIVMTLKG